ncbi:MAG: hypothetical protein EB139_04990, partial [Burkholderiaceae bacterium]|nr:hypothetical protein [Burkholderiaceae bacterium]
NLDLHQVQSAINNKTKAIMPVYLAGLPLDIDALYTIAENHQLRVIEDAAQALGSSWNGLRIGAKGRHDLVSFSFQANKNLTTIEGGCLVFNTDRFGGDQVTLAEKLRLQGKLSCNTACNHSQPHGCFGHGLQSSLFSLAFPGQNYRATSCRYFQP